MRIKPLLRVFGLFLLCEAALMLPSLIISIIYREGDTAAFALSILILIIIGAPLASVAKNHVNSLYAREGFALVGLGWIFLSLFGMLPFIFSGVIQSPVDAFFESVSGFSTTGASILTNVEGLPHGILFWRSFTNWVGGMGVLVLTIALLPQLGLKDMEILRAESPGPTPTKLLPKIRETAKILYFIYIGMSAILFISLLFTGMKPFDSAVNTFTTAGTGGFSVLNNSLAGYNNPAAEMIIAVFMLLFGINFSVYFIVLTFQFKKAFKNQELLSYIIIILASVLLISIDIFHRFGNIFETFRYVFFQVASIVTTTGFFTIDFDLWPPFSRCILLCLMLIGACAGSTSGGLKIVRLLVVFKVIHRELYYLLHPRIVRTVTIDGKTVSDNTIRAVLSFVCAYSVIIIGSTAVISLDQFDFITNFSAVTAAINNIGLGFEIIGPTGNFSGFSSLSKIVLSFCMLAGRLEIMPILLLFMPSLWKKM